MTEVSVLRNEPCGTGLRRLYTDGVFADYHTPGQFVSVAVPPKPAFFAICSSPGEPMELLVKDEGASGAAVAAAAPGTKLHVNGPMGSGFAVARLGDRPLVLFVNGSGLSAARPVIRAELGRRPITLLYGVITPDRRAFADELERWGNAGVQVHTVVEQPESTGWNGHRGYVQDVAASLGLIRADVGVVMVGVPKMIESVKAVYIAAGAPAEHLLVNY